MRPSKKHTRSDEFSQTPAPAKGQDVRVDLSERGRDMLEILNDLFDQSDEPVGDDQD